VREQRVVTPDGHVWHVRRRWAKRRLPWRRSASTGELAPAEREAVPVLPDRGEVLDAFGRLIYWDVEFGLLLGAGLAVAGLLVLGVVMALTWSLVLPLLAAEALPIVVVLVLAGVVVLLDRLTRPWFIEAQSARLVGRPPCLRGGRHRHRRGTLRRGARNYSPRRPLPPFLADDQDLGVGWRGRER
jgi:hypothetical protein